MFFSSFSALHFSPCSCTAWLEDVHNVASLSETLFLLILYPGKRKKHFKGDTWTCSWLLKEVG